MKTRVAWLVAVALAAVVCGYLATRCWVCRQDESELERLQDVSHLARALELRPDQVAAVGALQKAFCGNLAACCARHCACRGDLAALLVSEPFDSRRARETREALCRAYADSELATLEHMRSIRDLLDQRQRARFDRMIVEAFRRPCGMCPGGRCACETRSVEGARP